MHSAGLELTKLTYARLEDNLIRHRGDRFLVYYMVTPVTKLYHYILTVRYTKDIGQIISGLYRSSDTSDHYFTDHGLFSRICIICSSCHRADLQDLNDLCVFLL